ncbi:hypothetical protein [Leucothrix pacifica]|uniref:Uncharacterized protein n=1 Tax=Leucothrix pacifica TaxID=1247513 RepID=A0A317CHR5_9GAMM|nr:hypothetical protein [Leucothrix pacifica]PWQ97681.1 hypothetical protein DKW60_09905 [Leucothrix pacifica]
MKLSINGVIIERYGSQHQAYIPFTGLAAIGWNPMVAYIKLLKLQADQEASDLEDCFNTLTNDLHRMEVSR